MSDKIDLKKDLKHLYHPSVKEPVIIDVPTLNYLMIDGHGDPNTAQSFKDAVSALYPLAYAVKFSVKKTQGIDYAVMPLEGLWWVEDMTKFSITKKSDWDWTMMILQPEFVTAAMIDGLRPEVAKKKGTALISQVRFERYDEGACVQIMHIGSYAAEGANIERIHAYAQMHGYERSGKHHEIYLNNMDRTAPEKLKTIIRQPIRKVNG